MSNTNITKYTHTHTCCLTGGEVVGELVEKELLLLQEEKLLKVCLELRVEWRSGGRS